MSYDPPPPRGGPSGRSPRPGPHPPQAPGEPTPPGFRPPTPPGGFDRPRPTPRNGDRPPTPPGGFPHPATPPGGVERPGTPPGGFTRPTPGPAEHGAPGARPATPPGGFDRPGVSGGAPDRPATTPRGFDRPGDVRAGEPRPGEGRPRHAEAPPVEPFHPGARLDEPHPGAVFGEPARPGPRPDEVPRSGAFGEPVRPGAHPDESSRSGAVFGEPPFRAGTGPGEVPRPDAAFGGEQPSGRRALRGEAEPGGRRRAPEGGARPQPGQPQFGQPQPEQPQPDLSARLSGGPANGRRPRPAPDPDATRYTAPVQPNADTTYTNAFSGSLPEPPGSRPQAPAPEHLQTQYLQPPQPQPPQPAAQVPAPPHGQRPPAPRPPRRPRPVDPPTEVIPPVEDDYYEDDEYYDEDDHYEDGHHDDEDQDEEDQDLDDHDRPAPPPDTAARKAVRAVGELLITMGLVILLFVVYEVYVTDLISAGKQDDATQALDEQWNANTVEAPDPQRQTKYELLDGQAFAKMYIPVFGPDYKFSIVEGTTDKDLEIGPGHYKNTALPGDPGNFAVAGHRVGKGAPFNDLDLLGSCDAIVVETQTQWFVYRVLPMRDEIGGWAERQANPKCAKVSPLGAPYDKTVGQEIVLPTQGEVIAPVPHFEGEIPEAQQAALMTLTTCHPRFSDKQRLIVHAVLTDSYPKAPGFVPDAMKES